MPLWGRDITSIARVMRTLPAQLGYAARCFRLFDRPLDVLIAYLRRTRVPGDVIRLRDGMSIQLSDHPHDVITVFVVFVREDYGAVPRDGVVIDIGANIGVFSLYAVHRGARVVVAVEPNSQSYALLQRNIETNGLRDFVRPVRAAVVGNPGTPARFPTGSSVYHRIVDGTTDGDWEWVDTIDLADLMADTGTVDLLKIDCEGAEYGILLNARPEVLDRVGALRLEYHDGRLDELGARLQAAGLRCVRLTEDTDVLGNAWYARPERPGST